MAFSTVAFAVDIEVIRTVYGSNDQTLYWTIEEKFSYELQHNDLWFEEEIQRGAITLRDALVHIIEGRPQDNPATAFQYGYAVELLCKHFGHFLEGDGLINRIVDLEIQTAILESGVPIPVPPPPDIPIIGHLTSEQVIDEYIHLKEQSLIHPDQYIEDARQEFRSFLRQAHQKGLGLVSFTY